MVEDHQEEGEYLLGNDGPTTVSEVYIHISALNIKTGHLYICVTIFSILHAGQSSQKSVHERHRREE